MAPLFKIRVVSAGLSYHIPLYGSQSELCHKLQRFVITASVREAEQLRQLRRINPLSPVT